MTFRIDPTGAAREILYSEDSIFHFTRRQTALEEILFGQTLLLNSFKRTDDPQEYKERLSGVQGWGIEQESAGKAFAVMGSVENILLNNTGFLSFCQNRYENTNIKSFASLKSRMWSQYAEGHRGICIVVSKDELRREVDQVFSKTEFLVETAEISYNTDFELTPNLLVIDKGDLDARSEFENALKYVEKHVNSLLFSKQGDYRDEDEFRLVSVSRTRKDANALVTFPRIDLSKCIKAIILGDRFSAVYTPTMRRIQEIFGVPLLKLRWEKFGYIINDLGLTL